EQEKLGFRAGHEHVPESRRPVHLLLQRHSRAAGKGRSVRVVDVADQPADFVIAVPAVVSAHRAVSPRVDGEGVQIRNEVHVRLFDSGQPFDRGAVELDLAVQRLGELGARDLDVLDDSVDVGELQAEESDVFGLADFQDLRLRQTWSRRVELQDLGLRHLALLFPHFGQNSMITVQLFKVFPKRSTQSRANLHTFLCKPPLRGPKAAARGSGNRKSPPKQGVRGTARSPARIGRWYKGSSRSLAALFQKGSGMAVEILSPRTIPATSLSKHLSG